MFIFYRLFHRCVRSTPLGPLSSLSPKESSVPSHSSDPILVWFTVFGLSLLFRPVAELVIRVFFFSACVLLTGTLDGLLNLLVGHAVLRAAKYKGYDPPLLSSIEAGSLGGIIVLGPTTLATVCLIALIGGLKLQKMLSTHVTFLLELAFVIAMSAAASSLGVTVVRYCTRLDDLNGPPLDATHAARAGALGACILTVPLVSTAAFFMREAQMMPSARNEPITPPPCLVDNLEYPVHHVASSPRTRPHRHVITHTAAE
ncbi:hypothetical protein L210DRAFT_3764842, partial [Boletus edulis BED1]